MKKIIQIILTCSCFILGQTPQEIKQAKNLIKSKGLSEGQVRSIAKQKGYSDKKINQYIEKEKSSSVDGKKIKIEMNKIILNESKEEDFSKNSNKVEESNNNENIIEENLELENYEDKIEEIELNPTGYFGYNIFKRDPALFQETSVGVVDPNYIIGPSDEIIVMLWGETQFRQVLTVDREGFIFIPEIGQVFVNGLNLKLLESKLFRVFSQSYASLDPQNGKATTFLDISLGKLRPLRIQVLGEVAQPGAYTVSPSTTLFSSLYYFNGPTYAGSLRDIQLIRGGEKIGSIDFYKYLLTGEKPKDQKLQLDDVIFIPRRLKSVTISGEINRSGIYELKSNEGFLSLISLAGGLKVTSYLDRSQIDRVVSFENRDKVGMDRIIIDVDLKSILDSKSDFSVQDGDIIRVFSISEVRQNIVTIDGAVVRPGIYDIGKALKISELIKRSDGLMGDAYTKKIDVFRTKPDFNVKIIKLDLNKILDGNLDEDIFLMNNDKVKVYSLTEMVDKKYVTINGHVKQEGDYLLQENMTLYDLIFKGGGFIDEDFKKQTYLKRAELVRYSTNNNKREIIPFNLELVLAKKGAFDTPLLSQDVIQIYSNDEIEGKTRYVSIEGHVKKPGQYELYENNMRIKDLLFKSGGFDDKLYKSQTFSDRADLIRFDTDRTAQKIISFNLDSVLFNSKSKQNYLLLPGDIVRVYSEVAFNRIKKVRIKGSVRKPGRYNYKNNMSLLDLILESNGLDDGHYMYKVEVSRVDLSNKDREKYLDVISFEINDNFEIIDNESYSDSKDFILEPHDLIHIRSRLLSFNQKIIKISGEVEYPGDYSILKYNETITDIIDRSGGLLATAFVSGSNYYRDSVKINVSFEEIIKNPKSNLNFKVQDGDFIEINRAPSLVVLKGGVNNPGVHKFVPKKRLRYYLSLAGGVSLDAEKDNIYIVYPSGDSKKYKPFSILSPKVKDGSVITVGIQKEAEPFDKTEYAKELSSILANLAQVIAILSLGQ